MRKRRKLTGALFLAGLCCAGAAVLSAQETESALQRGFGEVLDIRVINIEVVVTDGQDTPISGLQPQDFRLLVDGEEVPIDYFTEVRDGVARAAVADDGPAGVLAVQPGEAVGNSYLVFIDDYFSIGRDRDQVLTDLSDQILAMGDNDRMAVVAFDGKDLEMLTSWSSSPADLQAVLKEAKRRRSYGLQRLSERRQFELTSGFTLDELVFSRGGDGGGEGSPFANLTFSRSLGPEQKIFISRLTDQLHRSLSAATATLRSFAKPPGRKVMILLSGGWPFIPGDYAVGPLARLLLDSDGPFGADLYGPLIETANLLGYTIYAVDVPGLQHDFVGADRQSAPRVVGRSGIAAPSNFLRETETHSTLHYLAGETGGKALLNAQRRDAFAQIAGDASSYYWIGFSPTREWDDRKHDVEVEMVDTQFRTRARKSYLDSSRDTEVTMAVESALLFGGAAGANTLSVELGTPEPAKRRKLTVPLRIVFPLQGIEFLPDDDGVVADLELRVAVLDDTSRPSPIPVLPLTLRLDEQPAGNTVGTYETKLLLRRRPHEGVVAIHDPVSGRILSAGFEFKP